MTTQLSLSNQVQVNSRATEKLNQLRTRVPLKFTENPIGYFYRKPGARARSYIPQKYA